MINIEFAQEQQLIDRVLSKDTVERLCEFWPIASILYFRILVQDLFL